MLCSEQRISIPLSSSLFRIFLQKFLWRIAGNLVFLKIALVSRDDAIHAVGLGYSVLHRVLEILPIPGKGCIDVFSVTGRILIFFLKLSNFSLTS